MAKRTDNTKEEPQNLQEGVSSFFGGVVNLVGTVLLGLGIIFLFDNYLPGFDIGKLWPLILILIGSALLLRNKF